MRNSKKEERMLILTMVREGKVTVEESIKLLEALNEGDQEYNHDYGFSSYEMEEKFNNFTNSLDNFARDVGDKAKNTYKDLEPKLKNATKTVVEKTVSVLGDITESLNESLRNMEQSEDYKCENDPQYSAPTYGDPPANESTASEPPANDPKEN